MRYKRLYLQNLMPMYRLLFITAGRVLAGFGRILTDTLGYVDFGRRCLLWARPWRETFYPFSWADGGLRNRHRRQPGLLRFFFWDVGCPRNRRRRQLELLRFFFCDVGCPRNCCRRPGFLRFVSCLDGSSLWMEMLGVFFFFFFFFFELGIRDYLYS